VCPSYVISHIRTYPNTESSVCIRIWANSAPHSAGNTVQCGLTRNLLASFYRILCDTNEGQGLAFRFQVSCFHFQYGLTRNLLASFYRILCDTNEGQGRAFRFQVSCFHAIGCCCRTQGMLSFQLLNQVPRPGANAALSFAFYWSSSRTKKELK
jgi:hypothetical protein